MTLLPPPPVKFTAACPCGHGDTEWIGQAYVPYKILCPRNQKQHHNKDET